MKTFIVILCLVALVCVSQTYYRDTSKDVSGINYGIIPANAPSVGDVFSISSTGVVWITLTNFVRVWSGTSGGILLPIASTVFLSPNNTFSNLLTLDAAGVTRCPVTRQTVLQNLYVVMTPAPGSGKTNTITITTNGAACAITVSIIGTATNANDTTHSVTVPAGTGIGVKIVTAASSVQGKAAWSFEGR